MFNTKPCASCSNISKQKWINISGSQAKWLQKKDYVANFFESPTGFFVTITLPEISGWLWLSQEMEVDFSDIPHAQTAYMGRADGTSIKRAIYFKNPSGTTIRIRAPVPYRDSTDTGELNGDAYAPHAHYRRDDNYIQTLPFLVPECNKLTADLVQKSKNWSIIDITTLNEDNMKDVPKLKPVLIYGNKPAFELERVAKELLNKYSCKLVTIYTGQLEKTNKQTSEVQSNPDLSQTDISTEKSSSVEKIKGGSIILTKPFTLHGLKKHIRLVDPSSQNKHLYNQLVKELRISKKKLVTVLPPHLSQNIVDWVQKINN